MMSSERMPAEPMQPPRAISARFESRSFRTVAGPIAFVVLCLMIFAVYLPGVAIPYYGDDFGWIDTSTRPLKHFVQVNADGWYRPLQASIYTMVQKNFGVSTVPIHLLCFFIHALLCWLILNFMLELGYGWASALLAAGFMALSQANAFALLSNDTLSQVAGTFFGCLSLWTLVHGLSKRANKTRLAFLSLSVVSFALALSSKEATSAFFPILVCAVLFCEYRSGRLWPWTKKAFIEAAPFTIIFLAYLTVHSAIGANSPSFGSGVYNFDLGLNLPRNLLLDLLDLTVPVSTVQTFEAFISGETATLAVIIACSLLFFLTVAYGLWLRRNDLKIAAAIIFLLGSAFPMVLLNHVSELYVYNSMPFFSVLVGIGIGAVLESAGHHRFKQVIAACLGLMLVGHVAAIREKTLLMRENGRRASTLVAAIGTYINQVPPKGSLLLVNPASREIEYAVYLMPGFKVIEFGESYIKKIYGREDIDLRIIEEADLRSRRETPDTVILGLEGDSLRLLSKPAAKGEPYGSGNG